MSSDGRSTVRWAWWSIAAGAALIAASQWLHAPSVEYLVALIVATAGALIASIFVRPVQRWWALACALSLVAATSVAIPAQRDLWLVQHRWEAWQHDAA